MARDLSGSIISCRRIEVDRDFEGILLAAIRRELTAEQELDCFSEEEAATKCLEVALSPLEKSESAADLLKPLPAMVRLVVRDFIARAWAESHVDYLLSYDHRLYGCGHGWMEAFTSSLGCFNNSGNGLKTEWQGPLQAWAERLRWSKPVGAALLKLMTEQVY